MRVAGRAILRGTQMRTDLQPNTWEFETEAFVTPTGFREYDARWWFGHGAGG